MSGLTDTPPFKSLPNIHNPDHDDDLLSSDDDDLSTPSAPPTDHGRQFYLPSHQSNCTSNLLANKWMIFAGLLCCVIVYLLLTPTTDSTRQQAQQLLNKASSDSGGATSGKEVILYRQRVSPMWHLPSSVKAEPFPALSELIAGKTAPGLSTLLKCAETTARMAVMTSISPNPTAAEVGLALLKQQVWCTIVIGDKKGPKFAEFTSSEMLKKGVEQYVDKMTVSKQDKTDAADKIDHKLLLARIAYIDVDEQKLLPYELSNLTPYGSFSRKNLGFLLAFHSGASVVFDVDDDNIYLPNTARTGNDDLPIDTTPLYYASSEDLDHRDKGKVYSEASSDSMPDRESVSAGKTFAEPDKKTALNKEIKVSVFNPYPLYGAEDTWPRGFPLNWVKPTLKPDKTYDGKCLEKTRYCSAVVQQMLANHDPDVDAIFRLTNQKGMPFDFLQPEWGKDMDAAIGRAAPSVALPLITYTPFNAQATIIMPGAFFAMLLPYTVHGRVSDIWRSYIMETLISYYSLDTVNDYKKTVKTAKTTTQSTSPSSADPCITFTAPHIYHDRNAHNYQLDFNSELPLYMQAESLVSWLTVRQLGEKSCLRDRLTAVGGSTSGDAERVMADIMMLLYVDLYESGVVEYDEIAYVQAWLKDFARIQIQRKQLKEVAPPTATKPDDKTCWPKYAA